MIFYVAKGINGGETLCDSTCFYNDDMTSEIARSTVQRFSYEFNESNK